MKKICIALTLLLGLPLLAESYTYGSTGLNVILPGVGLGYRSYPSKNGYDISARVEGINAGWWDYRARGLYLYRPAKEGFYSGLGGGVEYSYYEGTRRTLPTADAVVGYEWRKTFLQLEATSHIGKSAEYYIPTRAINFGFDF